MFNKTITSEFFTTINIRIFIRTLGYLTYKLPFIRYGTNVFEMEQSLLSYIGNLDSRIISFYNGRSAIYNALKLIGLKKTDEVIVSGYTCVSVSNAVIQTGAKVVYSDIDKNNLGLDLKELQKNITKNTKVIIVQHTFGKPANIVEIQKIAKLNNILIIEDCAHSLGSRYNKQKLGSFGDFSIFSVGRDKVISGVTGGFLIVNNKNYFNDTEKIEKSLKMPGRWLTIKNLFYNIFAYLSYKSYDFFGLGKLIIFLARKLKLIPEILTFSEKNCNYAEFQYSLPNSLAYLTKKEFKKIKLKSTRRISISEYYDDLITNKYITPVFKRNKLEKNNYFRYPVLIKSAKIKEKLLDYMRSNNVLLGNTWSGINIVPMGTNLKKAKYTIGKCPISEDISSRILTIPNHKLITLNDAERIVQLLNNFKF